jgi:PilZ domain
MTSSAGTAAQAAAYLRRRSRPRFPMRSLAYVRLHDNNGGIIRDLTESGIALQSVTPLQRGESLSLRFELFSPRVRVETEGRVIWADETGQAGVSFLDLPARTRRAVRDWILIQMLNAAAASGRVSMFAPLDSQLVLSPAARPAISLPLPIEQESVRWGFLSFSIQGFSIFVDSLVLLCAVLLFSISAIAVMGGVPPLPLAAALLFAASAIFLAAYQLIFSDFLCGSTPGKRLAAEAAQAQNEEFLVTRFR